MVLLALMFGKIIQMKNWFLFLMLPLLGFSQIKKDTIKVYFLGGQSNMQGYGFNKDLPNDLKNNLAARSHPAGRSGSPTLAQGPV